MSQRKVLWKNGILMAPQHLQQADRYFESLLRSRGPFSWGLLDLQLDEQALRHGQLVLKRCQAILPDGTWVNIGRDREGQGGADDPPSAREIPAPVAGSKIGVWLALPERITDRFAEESQPTPDDFKADNIRPVLVGKKNLRIVFSGEAREGLVSLQLAELERDGASKPILSTEFVPTSLSLGATPYFARKLHDLSIRMDSRIKELFRRVHRSPNEEGLLYAISEQLPVLRHLQTAEVLTATQPLQLFERLLSLAGTLSPGVGRTEPPSLPTYNHRDLTSCFAGLIQILLSLLTGRALTIVRSSTQMAVADAQHTDWTGRVDPALLRDRKMKAYLVLSGNVMPAQELIGLVSKYGKLGGPKSLAEVVGEDWSGLPISFESEPPTIGTVPAGALHFRLQTERYPNRREETAEARSLYKLWSEVQETGAISFYLPGPMLGGKLPRIDLLIVGEEPA